MPPAVSRRRRTGRGDQLYACFPARTSINLRRRSVANYAPPQEQALWEGMARCYEQGLVGAVGTSNYGGDSLVETARPGVSTSPPLPDRLPPILPLPPLDACAHGLLLLPLRSLPPSPPPPCPQARSSCGRSTRTCRSAACPL